MRVSEALIVTVLAACAAEQRIAAFEICNGVDDDGDGIVDEGFDRDGDGFRECDARSASVDCADHDPTVHPGALEVCDGVDTNCDGVLPLIEEDGDDDGLSACAGDCDDSDSAMNAADADGDGWTTCQGDCDDADSTVWRGAPEVCNGRDDDCDGTVPRDERDEDGDGESPCEGDCNDADASLNSQDLDGDGYASCGVLPDCNDADPGLASFSVWYPDLDGDGFGDLTGQVVACGQPAGFEASSGDCDDARVSVHPGAVELCNGLDDDCNGPVDDGLAATSWFADNDGDGFGDAGTIVFACGAPPGFVPDSSDCDDATAGIHPGAAESCNGLDDDCDGSIDDAAVDAANWYLDSDHDGFGDPAMVWLSCAALPGHVLDGTDCDDGDLWIHPGAIEICGNGVDEDCTGADESCP